MPSVPTQNKVRVTVAVAGQDLGSFTQHEGGGVSGESLKIRPGGGEREVVLTSTKTYEDVTVRKLYGDDMRAKRLWLDGQVNKGEMVVSEQPLDADDNPFGKADVHRGILTAFNPPDSDANATGDGAAAFCELVCSVESWA